MTFPIDKFSSVNIELINDTRIASPRYFRYAVAGIRQPYFMLTMTSAKLDYPEGRALGAYLNSLQGELTKFDLPNPIPPIFQHTDKSTSATASQGDTTITVGGFGFNVPAPVAAGEIIQFVGNPKAYEVLSCTGTNGSGECTITLTQPLIENVSLFTVVKFGVNVIFQVRMTSRNSADITAEGFRAVVHDIEVIEQA